MAINYGVTFASIVDSGTWHWSVHSINNYNLIMTNKIISTPEPQETLIEIPGRNGALDMSDALRRGVRYKSRTIQIQFYSTKKVVDWSLEASNLWSRLAGNKIKIIFDDDLSYYWLARVTSVQPSYDGRTETILLTATADPYKYNITTSAEDWLWDPFDFDQDIINQTADIDVDTGSEIVIEATQKWENPIISGTKVMNITLVNGANEQYDYQYLPSYGADIVYDFVLKPGTNTFTITWVQDGPGQITIEYRGGSL